MNALEEFRLLPPWSLVSGDVRETFPYSGGYKSYLGGTGYLPDTTCHQVDALAPLSLYLHPHKSAEALRRKCLKRCSLHSGGVSNLTGD